MNKDFQFQNNKTGQILSPESLSLYFKEIYEKKPVIICSSSFILGSKNSDDKKKVATGIALVMLQQEQILQKLGFTPIFISGETDIQNENCFILPCIRSNYYPPIKKQSKNYFENHKKEIADVLKIVSSFKDVPFIVHNTSNSALHNPVFGRAIARLIEEDDCCKPILHVYDTRGADKEILEKFIPLTKKTNYKIILISKTKFDFFRKLYPNVPLDIFIHIPMPIDLRSFEANSTIDLPSTLGKLAPNLSKHINYVGINPEELELQPHEVFGFGLSDKKLVLLLPARIVQQKEIIYSIRLAMKIKELTDMKLTLIISGPPDFRKKTNEKYFLKVLDLINKKNIEGKIKIYPLLGIPELYFPSLMKQCTIVMGLFRNEGFGIFIPQSAVVGVPLAISSDTSFLEASQNNACVLPLYNEKRWPCNSEIASRIIDYLGDQNKMRQDINRLKVISYSDYDTESLIKSYRKLFC